MTARDVAALQRQVDHLTHAASRIRQQLADLHSIAWDPSTATTDPGDRVSGGTRDHTPRSGPDVAKALWSRTETELGRCEALLVGLERKITGWFMVTAAIEPSRGSLITAGEHARRIARQNQAIKDGDYVPTRLMDMPDHPGKHR